MSYAVQSPSLLPPSFKEAGGNTEPSPSIGARIKNALFGRVCADWKNSVLVAGVVFWVAKAAVSFFTGYWMMAVVELFTGGFLAMMRKDYRVFTNLHAATGDYRRENDHFRLSNLRLKQTTEEFKAEVGNLAKEREKIGKENKQFALSNTRYKTHLGTMEATLDKAVGEIDSASKRGRNVSKRVLTEALDSFDAQKRTLKSMEREILDKKDETLKRWGQIVEQVGSMGVHHVEAMEEADRKLQETLRQIASYEGQKTQLEGQISRLQGQVDRLDIARKKIDTATDRNLESANQVHRATAMLNFFFKGLCGSGDQGAREQSSIMLVGILSVGAVAWQMFKTPVAAAA